ncbi:MAG: 16S rRNA (cytosine(967)-C(5))-methyltransferase RsmB [Anaerovoracaceae bacterium]|jgi:16S rRNA (cytosine967-C5)-methyltransferase
MDINRRAAYEALYETNEKEAYSNIAVNKAVKRFHPDDEAFVRSLVYGVLENQIYIDYMLDGLIKTGITKVNPRARTLLRMGVCQIEFMNSVPDYTAVDETVKLSKKMCRSLSGFVNGVLRSYIRKDRRPLPDRSKDPAAYLSVRYSYSRDIADMWISMYGAGRAEEIMKAGNSVPELVICVNTLKTTAQSLSDILVKKGFEVRRPETDNPDVMEHALLVKGSGLMSVPEFSGGLFYVQDMSSMEAVSALAPEPGETVADICAAPGGKSFFASMLMKNTGHIVTCDIYEHKLKLIEESASRLGIDIIEVKKNDGRVTNPDLTGAADRVIADVPCSGLGVVRRRPEIKTRFRKEKLKELAALQLEILSSSAPYVREHGKLMYSTCTISDEENERVKNIFLKKFRNFSVEKEAQLLPDFDGTDGFYFCVFEKL